MTNNIKLRVGQTVELNNGERHKVAHMRGDDPLRINGCGFGPFSVSGFLFHQDGRFGSSDQDHPLSVARIISEPDELANKPTIGGWITYKKPTHGAFTNEKGYKVVDLTVSGKPIVVADDGALWGVSPGNFEISSQEMPPRDDPSNPDKLPLCKMSDRVIRKPRGMTVLQEIVASPERELEGAE